MSMERFTISMYEEDIDLFERTRTDLELTKSAFIRFLLAEHYDRVPNFIKHKELIKKISELNTSIKELLLTDELSDTEKIHVFEKMDEINKLIEKLLK